MPNNARRAVFLLLLLLMLPSEDSACTGVPWLQVPSDSVFVTRFMGGYTENVPPDEFDALPVRRLVASLRSMMVIVPENPLLGTY